MLGQVDLHQMYRYLASKLRKTIKNDTLGFAAPEPLGKEGPDLQYFLLGNDAYALDRENSKLQDLQRLEGGGESIWNISDQIQGGTVHHGAKAKKCQRHCFNMCGVAQHA